MANEEDLARLRQGVVVWNEWRARNIAAAVHLEDANLKGADLEGANLRAAKLTFADLEGANLRKADLSGADLFEAILDRADLEGANLARAYLRRAGLRRAHLSAASLSEANLYWASLHGADLQRANLQEANLWETSLSEANLKGAHLYETLFVGIDLSKTQGLEDCKHEGRSVLDPLTLQLSGRLPLTFLRGCGLPDQLIDYLPSLFGQAIQYYSCFISYSSKDEAFAKRLYADLQNNGVRCWFAPHDLPIGAKTWDAIDAAIRGRDKLLLIFSENAIASDWVEDEVSKAFAEERRRGQTVLFPVRIDETVMTTAEPWAVKLRDQRNIGDFRHWQDHGAYETTFDKVLRDLKAESARSTAES